MGFEADWLALRAPADDRARDEALRARSLAFLASRAAPLIVDLGCGAGASLRALAPDAPADARWLLVDNDPALLTRASSLASELGQAAQTLELDLAAPKKPDAASLETALGGADLVVASAFLDLVSATWLARLVEALPARSALYMALSYSGKMHFDGERSDDSSVVAAFNAHQAGDKGFGPALGPKAAEALAEKLEGAGRKVALAPSDWRLSATTDAALIAELTGGIASAVAEMGVDSAGWRAARRDAGGMVVSHLDIYASPLV